MTIWSVISHCTTGCWPMREASAQCSHSLHVPLIMGTLNMPHVQHHLPGLSFRIKSTDSKWREKTSNRVNIFLCGGAASGWNVYYSVQKTNQDGPLHVTINNQKLKIRLFYCTHSIYRIAIAMSGYWSNNQYFIFSLSVNSHVQYVERLT